MCAINRAGRAVIIGGEIGNRDRACRNDCQTGAAVIAGDVGAAQRHVISFRVKTGSAITIIQVHSPVPIVEGGYVAQRNGACAVGFQPILFIPIEGPEAGERETR